MNEPERPEAERDTEREPDQHLHARTHRIEHRRVDADERTERRIVRILGFGERHERSQHPRERGGERGLQREHPARTPRQASHFLLRVLVHRARPMREPPQR